MEGPTENNEAPLSPISQDFLDRWDAKGKSKEIFEPPQGVSRKTWEKHVSRALEKDQAKRHEKFLAKQERKVEKYWKRVGLNTVHPDSITEKMLDEDDNIPMSDEEGVQDADDFTTHHTNVHGVEATVKADDNDEEGVICLWERGEKE